MNTFGSSTLQFGLCDPKDIVSNRERFHRDAMPKLAKANSFRCPVGKMPAKGWILLPRSEYVQLNSYASNLQLQIDKLAPFKNLSIVHAECVTRGLAADSDALYLIELTDARGVLKNEWFQYPINAQYNVRAPAYPQSYYSLSLNSGTPWTWSGMIGDIWAKMSGFLGTYPGIPTSPTSTPENYMFIGVSALDALCDVLEHIGLTLACDLTSNTPYTIVYAGAGDTTFTTLQTKYATNLEDDSEWIDTGSGRVPSTIIVYFNYRAFQYGQEETIRQDSLQWSSLPLYSVAVSAPSQFANAVGTHFLHDDFTVRRDIDGNVNTADAAIAASIASERVTQYFANIYSLTAGYMTQVYAGALPFTTGPQVDCVRWALDTCNRRGWKTYVYRGGAECILQ